MQLESKFRISNVERIRMKVLRRDGGAEGRGQIANLDIGD